MLRDYLILHYLPERPGLSADYCRLLGATVDRLCAWAGRTLQLAEVDRALLAGWATQLLQDWRPSTVNDKVRMIRTLLLAAYDDELLYRPPRRNRHQRENLPPPEAWTIDECRMLFAYLGALNGWVCGAKSADWWVSFCLALYWTACRPIAMLRVQVADYRPGQGLTVRKQKNGNQQWYPLPASCCEAIDRIAGEPGPLWVWPFCENTLWLHFRRHVEAAGLPCPKTHCQLFYRLKRTNLSYCAAEDPAIAQRQADHADWETTRRHYIDPTIAPQRSAADVLPDPLQPDGRPHLRVIG